MVEDKIENLLIIGNGFDLARYLPTSFNNYIENNKKKDFQIGKKDFENFLEDVENVLKNYNSNKSLKSFNWINDNISSLLFANNKDKKFSSLSFWDIYMITKKHIKDSTNNWADIEGLLFDFFNGKHNFKKLINSDYTPNNFNDILKRIKFMEQLNIIDNISNNLDGEYDSTKQNFYLQLLIYKFMINQNKISNIDKYYEYLISELHKFEKNFSDYLLEILSISYTNESSSKLISYILDKDIDKKFNLLDFNYDNFDNSHVNKINYIHGSLKPSDKKPIIIGFDSSGISPNEPYYKFTKASRIMEQSVIESESILDKNIKNIYFYGHSLADADNSYFNAIFDYYDLYNKDINLIFCYTPYKDTSKENEKLKSEKMNAINNLIFNYGKTLNDSHGENILPKLLLENRLHLKEIPKI